jgi:phage-related protein
VLRLGEAIVPTVLLFQDTDRSIPFVDWLRVLPPKVVAKVRLRLERLAELGHGLRRPEADFLRDGIYELRIGYLCRNYRVLYFFHGRAAAVVSHGLMKEREVPPREIDLAIERKKTYEADPDRHTAAID